MNYGYVSVKPLFILYFYFIFRSLCPIYYFYCLSSFCDTADSYEVQQLLIAFSNQNESNQPPADSFSSELHIQNFPNFNKHTNEIINRLKGFQTSPGFKNPKEWNGKGAKEHISDYAIMPKYHSTWFLYKSITKNVGPKSYLFYNRNAFLYSKEKA